MALVTVDDDSSSKHLKLESIPLIDLRLFSQSELNSLSHCSNDAFDLRRCDDIVIPKIDRSVFNESAGSRKQTYSRLRLAPRQPEINNLERRHRRFLSVSKTPPNPIDDPERKENKRIVSLLRELFAKDNNSGTDLIPIFTQNEESSSFPEPLNVENGVVVVVQEDVLEGEKGSRKRGRKSENDEPDLNRKGKMQGNGSKAIVVYKKEANDQNVVMEIVNRNGVVVDIAALENMDDPFGPELKRRTVGLENEAEFLGFLRGFEGQWGSRRKKKRIIDAAEFGDYLPNRWKLLIGIKRKGGRMWLNCRQYISPNGLKFVSCKEVSSYLHSAFGAQDTNKPNPYHSDEIHVDNKLTSRDIAGLSHRDERTREDLPASPLESLPIEDENKVPLSRAENLADVEVKDLLECQKCKMSFDEKDVYLLHLMTSHQSATRCGLGTSICDGLITSDGKYECQFCHENFQENHNYNDHVGVHMRNYAKSLEVLPSRTVTRSELSSLSGVPSGISNLDESVDVDNSTSSQPSAEPNDGISVMDPGPGTFNTIANSELNAGSPYCNQDTGGTGSIQQIPTDKPNEGSPHSKLDVDSKPGTSTENSNCEGCVGSPYNNQNTGADKIDLTLTDELSDKKYRGCGIADDKLGKINDPNCNHDVEDDKFDLRLAGESCDKQYRGYDLADDKLGEINDPNRNHDIGDDKIDLTLAGESCDTQYRGYDVADEKLGEINDPNINHDIGDVKIDLTLAAESCDKQYRCYEIADVKLGQINEPNINHDVRDDKIDLTLAGESCDKQYRGYDVTDDKLGEPNVPNNNHDIGLGDGKIDLTLAAESCDKQYRGYEIADDKLGEINDPNSNLYVQLNSCFGSASILANSEEFSTSKFYDGKYVLGSTISEIDKYTIEQEAGSGSCWLTLSCGEQINGVATSNGLFSVCEKNSQLGEAKDYGNNEPENFGARYSGPDRGPITETVVSTAGNIPEAMIPGTSSLLMKSSDRFPTLNLISTQGENDFYTDNQKHEKVSNFQELGLDGIEASKFNNFMTGQGSSSLPMDLAYDDADLEQGFGTTSVQFDWDAVLPKMEYRQQLVTTLCVWCGAQFSHEAVNLEMESDSVGFMCPTCKAKISGQLFGIG